MKTCYVGVPPGIGDIYWVLTKLKSKKEIEKIDKMFLVIYTVNMKITAGVLVRSKGIDSAVDFLDGSIYGEYDHSQNRPVKTKFLDGQRRIIDVMWPNEYLEQGNHLTTWMPQYETDLNLDIKYEDYPGGEILVYPSAIGTNKNWTKADDIWWADLIWDLYLQFGHRPTIIGASWDMDMWRLIRRRLRAKGRGDCYTDLVGETTLKEVFGVIKNAKLLVGVISGMTIIANHYNTSCVALSPTKFHEDFPYTWVRDVTDMTYQAIRCDPLPSIKKVVAWCKRVYATALYKGLT